MLLLDTFYCRAHKAANPQDYPPTEKAKALYPVLRNINEENVNPTKVHLQVYDGKFG